MSDKVYEIPAEWGQRAYVNDAKYREMYARSLKDPNGFREEADGAMNWVDIGPQAPGIPGAGSSSAPP